MKVCAVSEISAGFKFVIRLKDRPKMARINSWYTEDEPKKQGVDVFYFSSRWRIARLRRPRRPKNMQL